MLGKRKREKKDEGDEDNDIKDFFENNDFEVVP